MPSRDERSARASARPSATSASTRPNRHNQQSSKPAKNDDDVWNEIMDMKSKGDGGDGGFNKMNTNFYLKDGEEIDIVILDENPEIFWGHVIKCKTDAGQTFYRTEQCQKSEQDYCVLCESDNKAISKAKKIIAFRVLDSRGNWDSENKCLDGIPAPKIFLTPLYLAKQFKTLRDDAGGTISDKVIKLSKNGNYQANFKFKKLQGGGLDYVSAPDYNEELPNISEVYAPMGDNELMEFVRKFADGSDASSKPSRGGNNKRGGNASGSFGD